MRPTYIIIHHSLTKDSGTVSWSAIRRYHVETMGWRDIGYHYGIELVGDRYEILVGRMINEIGAHCSQQGMNRTSLGICCVGNFDVEPIPEAQITLLVKLTQSLMDSFGIPKDHVKMHREFATYKSCPGERFPWDSFVNAL